MAIGLCGAHRTGKTTLARAFSEKRKMPFLETSTSKIFKELGISPSADLDFDTRIMVQESVLEDYLKRCFEMKGCFITDRTPIDFMAYTLAEIGQSSLTLKQEARFKRYMDKCVEAVNRHFSTLVIVSPGIPIIYEEGKASLSPAYIEHISTLVHGLVIRSDIRASHFSISRHCIDLEERVFAVEHAFDVVLERHAYILKQAEEGGANITRH